MFLIANTFCSFFLLLTHSFCPFFTPSPPLSSPSFIPARCDLVSLLHRRRWHSARALPARFIFLDSLVGWARALICGSWKWTTEELRSHRTQVRKPFFCFQHNHLTTFSSLKKKATATKKRIFLLNVSLFYFNYYSLFFKAAF